MIIWAVFPGVQALTFTLNGRVWCFLWQPSKNVQFEIVSAVLRKSSTIVEDVGFLRKAILALDLHPKIQVKCYHFLGVMPRMGNQGSVRHRTKLRAEVIQEQNEINVYLVWRAKPLRLFAIDAEYIAYILWYKKKTPKSALNKEKGKLQRFTSL